MWREAVVYKITEARTAAVLAIKTAAQGRAVQVDPSKPTFKAPGTKRLKLKYDELLTILLRFRFQFQLAPLQQGAIDVTAGRATTAGVAATLVGRCTLAASEFVLKAPIVSALESISHTAFNCCFQFQLAPLHPG